jgi:hypothetical protein
VILGKDRKPLVTEFFGPEQQTFQTHYWKGNPITNEDQVQIYEELVTDPKGLLTTSFMSLNRKAKDNRLQPQGRRHRLAARLMAMDRHHLAPVGARLPVSALPLAARGGIPRIGPVRTCRPIWRLGAGGLELRLS